MPIKPASENPSKKAAAPNTDRGVREGDHKSNGESMLAGGNKGSPAKERTKMKQSKPREKPAYQISKEELNELLDHEK